MMKSKDSFEDVLTENEGMSMKKATILLILLTTVHVSAQEILEPDSWIRRLQQRQLVDLPTAVMPEPGSYTIDLRMFADGGVLGGVSVGLTPSFTFGVSYGGEGVVGEGDADWNPDPGVFVRIRLFGENRTNGSTYGTPALVIGFDSQGFGRYKPDFKRYEYKSRGLYAVTSMTYFRTVPASRGGQRTRGRVNLVEPVYPFIGMHGGLNWSPEGDGKDDELNLFIGGDIIFNPEIRILAEYDFGINDNEDDDNFGSGNGFLNASIQWLFQKSEAQRSKESIFLEFAVKNVLKNGATPLTRELKVGFLTRF